MSFLIPSITEIQTAKYTPSQLVKNEELERFFTVGINDNFKFLLDFYSAFRSGKTSFVYATDSESTATAIETYLTDSAYGKGYTVEITPPDTSLDSVEASYITKTGKTVYKTKNSQKYLVSVSWA